MPMTTVEAAAAAAPQWAERVVARPSATPTRRSEAGANDSTVAARLQTASGTGSGLVPRGGAAARRGLRAVIRSGRW